METAFDVIVVGLGAMGSAAVYHLSKRHIKALGLEAHTPAHDKGSSHGESRIIRQAYFENPAYVPLVLRAYELWDELQKETGKDLFTLTGGLAIGSPDGELVSGCLRSARKYGLAHELLNPRDMQQRFPQFVLGDHEIAFYEPKAGFLRPEECIRQHLRAASTRGADLRFEEPVLSWTASQSGEGVTVKTAKQTYRAGSLVISVGPWFAEFVSNVFTPVAISRRVMFWLKPVRNPEAFDRDVFPIYLWQPGEGPLFYGFPRLTQSGDPKVAIHSEGDPCTPSTIDRKIHPRDELAIRFRHPL